MKGKIFKKIVSAFATVTMLAQFAVIPAFAEEYLRLDYELSGSISDWTAPSTTVTLGTDSNSVINNYVNVPQSGGDSRTAYYTFPTDAQRGDESVIEFDFYLSATTERSTQLFVYGVGVSPKTNDVTTTGYVLRYDQPKGGGEFAVNMTGGSKTMEASAIANHSAKTTGYSTGKWAHSKAILNFEEGSAEISITSLEGDTTYYNGKVAMDSSVTALGGISLLAPRPGGTIGIDNIVVRDKTSDDVTDTYYTVTYDVNGTVTSESVKSGENVAALPDTDMAGQIFKGWQVDDDSENLITSDEITQTAITANVKYTAIYEVDTKYIEPIVSATIEGADLMTIGADADTAAENEYIVKLVGEKGTVITADTLDEKVTDFSVSWEIDGFKTENDVTDNSYCDYYGGFESKVTNDVKAVFNLRKNASMNFFGMLRATVTYDGKTVTASKAVAAISNKDIPSNRVLPEEGYPSDFGDYPDAFNGYKSYEETYGSGGDSILGGWVMSGSDAGKSAIVTKDGDESYVRVTSATAKKSHMFTNSISAPASQIIFEQDVRFNSAYGNITLTAGYPIYGNRYVQAFSLSYNGTTITLNDNAIKKDDADVTIDSTAWYKVVISADKTNETCFVKVYNTSGELVGETGNVAWIESCDPTFYSIGLGNNYTGTIDFNNYKAYYPIADESTFKLDTTQTTLSIPNGDTADLTASLKTADGYDVTGTATWTVVEDDMKEGVIITPDETDSHKATVTLSSTAVAGEATVQVNVGGYVKTVKLNITSLAESVKFTKSSSSLSIPIEDGQTTVATYVADVINGSGEELGRGVTLAIYDKTNTTEYVLPEGITFNAETGILTISSDAKACTFTVRATGKNTDGEDITRSIKVTVHGLAFDFGAGTDEDIAEGYTSVTPSTAYNETYGYGIVGTVTAGGTGTVDNADSDYIEGAMTFKAKVSAINHYKVEITYRGTLKAEPVNSDLSGSALGSNTELTKATYTVPVIDDVLELVLSDYTYTVDDKGTDDTSDDEKATAGAQIASIVITKLDKKNASAKPSLYVIGDSTLSNNGSWGYYLGGHSADFPELYNIVDVHICGRGGSNLSKYYTSGDFFNKILLNVRPGDVVSLGNMGTNGGAGALFENDFNYYLDAVEALGAKIMIHSYSPHGATPSDTDKNNGLYYNSNLSWYNPETQIFSGKRTDAYDNIARRVAEERAANDPNYIGFVDIGERADAAFNAYVNDYAANGYASREDAAKAIIACFPDHNHYNGIASELIVAGYGEVDGTAAGYVDVLTPYVDNLEPIPTDLVVDKCDFNTDSGAAADVKVTNYTGNKANVSAVIAAYDSNGTLIKVAIESYEIQPTKYAEFNPTLSVENTAEYKLFVWDMNNYKPLK